MATISELVDLVSHAESIGVTIASIRVSPKGAKELYDTTSGGLQNSSGELPSVEPGKPYGVVRVGGGPSITIIRNGCGDYEDPGADN